MAKKTSPQKKDGVMDAVTALTTLGDEEEAKVETAEDEEDKVRFIPEHKKPDAALTFPEKVSSLLCDVIDE